MKITLSDDQLAQLSDMLFERLKAEFPERDGGCGMRQALVKADAIAKRLNCSVSHIKVMVERGEIPFFRLGKTRALRFDENAVLESLFERAESQKHDQ